MRMRAHDVQQAGEHISPVLVPVLVVSIVLVVIVVAVLVAVTVLVLVLMILAVVMTGLVVVLRAALTVHDIKHARIIALRHLDSYQGRAPANRPQRHPVK